MKTDIYGKNKTVPYSHTRGTVSDDSRYLTDATDKGATWTEGGNTVLTLRNHQQSWYFTETRTVWRDEEPFRHRTLLRASIRRNAYDEQSEIRYEVWNGMKWETKHIMGVEGTPVEHVSYTTPLYKLDTEVFRQTADIVWDIACAYGDM